MKEWRLMARIPQNSMQTKVVHHPSLNHDHRLEFASSLCYLSPDLGQPLKKRPTIYRVITFTLRISFLSFLLLLLLLLLLFSLLFFCVPQTPLAICAPVIKSVKCCFRDGEARATSSSARKRARRAAR